MSSPIQNDGLADRPHSTIHNDCKWLIEHQRPHDTHHLRKDVTLNANDQLRLSLHVTCHIISTLSRTTRNCGEWPIQDRPACHIYIQGFKCRSQHLAVEMRLQEFGDNHNMRIHAEFYSPNAQAGGLSDTIVRLFFSSPNGLGDPDAS